jgi:hypothetical protein
MTKFGITTMPRSVVDTLALARTSAELGFSASGVGDGHFPHKELYSVITATLLSTSSITVVPTTTNNIARSWSVHASSARTLTS